jgi:NTE family protein
MGDIKPFGQFASRVSSDPKWQGRTLRHPEVLERPNNHEGVFTFDLAVDGRE